MVLVLAVTEFVEPVAHLEWALGLRLAGALSLWLAGERAARSGLRAPWLPSVAAVGVVVWSLAVLQLHGGERSVLMPWVPALGLGMAALLEGRPRAVLVAHVLLLAGLSLVFWSHGAPLAAYLRWLPPTALLGGVFAWAAALSARTRAQLLEAVEAGVAAADHERELRRELEAQRAYAEKAEHLALLGQVASGVAHEVNNPLAVLKANVEYAAEISVPRSGSGATPAELEEAFADAGAALERIRLVVVQLKAFAEEGPRAPQVVSALSLLTGAVGLAALRVKPPVALTPRFGTDLPAVSVDAERLTHVLVGLMLNAAQALEGERPMRPAPRIEVTAVETGGALVVEVLDNGPGFSKEGLERVFAPFFTTKTEGAGMGLTLSVARRYLRSVGGELQADNRPAGGARLRLVLPVAR